MTGWSSWFRVWVRILTIPWSGRDFDGLTSSTSDMAWSVSPGRTGLGHFSSSAPAPIEPPANLDLAIDDQPHREGGRVPAAGDQAAEEGRRGRRLVEVEGLRVELGGERLDLVRIDRDGPAPECLAHGEVFQIAFLGHVSFLRNGGEHPPAESAQLHRAAGFCFHSQMIQSTFLGSPPKSLSRVMHWPRWCCECIATCTMASLTVMIQGGSGNQGIRTVRDSASGVRLAAKSLQTGVAGLGASLQIVEGRRRARSLGPPGASPRRIVRNPC